MNRSLIGVVVLAAAVVLGATAAWATEPEASAPSPADPAEAVSVSASETASEPETSLPAMAAAQRVQIDPATGKRVTPSADKAMAIDARSRGMMSRSTAGLLEVPSAKSGVMVDLLGRFRSATVIELGAESVPAIDCVTTLDPVATLTGDAVEVSHE